MDEPTFESARADFTKGLAKMSMSRAQARASMTNDFEQAWKKLISSSAFAKEVLKAEPSTLAIMETAITAVEALLPDESGLPKLQVGTRSFERFSANMVLTTDSHGEQSTHRRMVEGIRAAWPLVAQAWAMSAHAKLTEAETAKVQAAMDAMDAVFAMYFKQHRAAG